MDNKDQQAYDYARKVYEAKLKKRGPDDPGTLEWKAKMQLLSPEGGGSEGKKSPASGKKSSIIKSVSEKTRSKKKKRDEDDEAAIPPVNIHGSY